MDYTRKKTIKHGNIQIVALITAKITTEVTRGRSKLNEPNN